MAIRQVLLNGSGTSGDGTTWNDLSDATSAYIGSAGFASAINASAAGDVVYVKGVDSTATASITLSAPTGAASVADPVRVYGCKSATTNNQGSIVQSDLIPGLATGNATPAYDDADIPAIRLAGTSADTNINANVYLYGLELFIPDNLFFGFSGAAGFIQTEECLLKIGATGDLLSFAETTPSRHLNCKLDGGSGGYIYPAKGGGEIIGGEIVGSGSSGILERQSGAEGGQASLTGVDFSGSSDTIIVGITGSTSFWVLKNCRFPASHSLTAGTSTKDYRIEAWGCSETGSGITTSVQALEIETAAGTINEETVKIRTSGADDGAAGGYSLDFTTFAADTSPGNRSLVGPWLKLWVAGDGTSKTLTIYFTSDSGNTRATDWNDDEVWAEVLFPSAAGSSQHDRDSSKVKNLGTPAAVPDDTGSTWAAGTARDQKIEFTIAPDYEGIVQARPHFAPGTNAETIYVCPEMEMA